MIALEIVALLLIGVLGTAVVLTRDPTRQALVVAMFGLPLPVLFLLFDAPGVALAQGAVSAIIFPLLLLFALAKVATRRQ